MDKIATELKEDLLHHINIYQYDKFKKENPNIYSAILETLRSINNKHINNDLLILEKPDIKKLQLKIGVEKTFIFGGVFFLKGYEVVLLELTNTIGTYYMQDSIIARQLKNYKIGNKVRFEAVLNKDNMRSIAMTLPYEKVDIGLFDDEESSFVDDTIKDLEDRGVIPKNK